MTGSRRVLTVWPPRPYRPSLPGRQETHPLREMVASARHPEATGLLREAKVPLSKATVPLRGVTVPSLPLDFPVVRVALVGGGAAPRCSSRSPRSWPLWLSSPWC
jgi:hypothetical protein